MLALHLLQSALVHVNTLLVQHGTFRLDMDKRLDLGPAAAVPRLRSPAYGADRSRTGKR
jgi:hypothetical protein